jgi:hypothetical protein
MSMVLHAQGRAIFALQRLEKHSPQAALLMLECDRSLASHRYTLLVMTEDGDDSDSDSDEEEDDERSPMTAHLRLQRLDPEYMPVYRALIVVT